MCIRDSPTPLPSGDGAGRSRGSVVPSAIAVKGSIQLNSALLERLFPPHGFAAEEDVELLGRAGYRIDAGLLKFVGGRRVGVDAHDLGLQLVDDRTRGAG